MARTNVFSMSTDDARSDARDVLVLMPATSSTITGSTHVTVIGTVRAFTCAEVGEGAPRLGAEPHGRLTRPIVLAGSVRTRSGEELVLQPSEFRC